MEKLVKNLKSLDTMKCCIKYIQFAITNATKELNQSSDQHTSPFPVLVITDMSPYGTDSCSSTNGCLQKAQYGLNLLRNITGTEPSFFDPKQFNASRAEAGLVEQEVLGWGRKLIAVGGGIYQSKILNKFHYKLNMSIAGVDLYSVCAGETALVRSFKPKLMIISHESCKSLS